MRVNLDSILNDQLLLSDLTVQQDIFLNENPELLNYISGSFDGFNSSMIEPAALLYFYLDGVQNGETELNEIIYSDYSNLLSYWFDQRAMRDINDYVTGSLWRYVGAPGKGIFESIGDFFSDTKNLLFAALGVAVLYIMKK